MKDQKLNNKREEKELSKSLGNKKKKVLVGKVLSDKMQKTVVVEISRKVQHPIYKKLIKRTKKIKADTNGLDIKIGEEVKIEETKPISRGKFFKVIEKIGNK